MHYLLVIGEKFGVWLKDLITLPVNLAKVADINKYLEVQKELSEAQKGLKEAKEQLDRDAAIKKGRMFFGDNVVWAKGEDGKVEKSPYCSHCFELDSKLIHLITIEYQGDERRGKCPECNANGIYFRIPK